MPPKETPLTSAQINEFSLNRLGYYVKVREQWNNTRKKKDFLFDIYKGEELIQKGTKVFPCGEKEAIAQRNTIIDYYLKKIQNEKTI